MMRERERERRDVLTERRGFGRQTTQHDMTNGDDHHESPPLASITAHHSRCEGYRQILQC